MFSGAPEKHQSCEVSESSDKRTFPLKWQLTHSRADTIHLGAAGVEAAAGTASERANHEHTGSETENASCFQKTTQVGRIYSFQEQGTA